MKALDRIHARHFPATRPQGTDGSRAADLPAPPGGVFSYLTGIWREWLDDIREAWRLPTLDECESDLECPDCGEMLHRCRCGGGE